jgi:threonine dehydrogenase-like Zn-dependent dehydrogenase
MKAIAVLPGKTNSIHIREVPEPPMSPEHVLVQTIRCGLCGTDADIVRGEYGQAPAGDDYLVLGHENFGVVLEAGSHVNGFAKGDYVVSTVRRPCGICYNCEHGENDFCTSGKYTERGIMRRHGFMSERYSELPAYLNKIAPQVAPIGVLLEPMSVVEKGIDQAFQIQRRVQWRPVQAVVLGAGPVGILASSILRNQGLACVVVGREEFGGAQSQIVQKIGADYFSVGGGSICNLAPKYKEIDLIVEATGSPSVVFDAMQMLSPNGVLCLLSVTGGHLEQTEPVAVINQELVLRNNVVFGSVNANPRHFRMGAQHFVEIEQKWPGVLAQLITTRLPMTKFQDWFDRKVKGIKTTLEFAGDAASGEVAA